MINISMPAPETKTSVKRIAFIGNYIPRQCGIATFTTDLADAISGHYSDTDCIALAINDRAEGYAYLPRVKFELNEGELTSYQRAADYLNFNDVDVISLQHEFGIFGGPAGSHIIELLREVNIPIVTTLHTVLKDPNPSQFQVMKELIHLSNRLVVMSLRGIEYLKDIYGVEQDKIDFIHHGIPDLPFVDPNFYKDQFGVEGKTVVLTFGLLSANKGIEYVIQALPEVLENNPNLVYIILGATHPNVLRSEGERYRNSLINLAEKLGIRRNVIFDNRFVTQEELVAYIGAADIYITPYLNPQQITSGTLAYTVGAGKAVISTPYWYAEELLAEDRGLLVPFADSNAISEKMVGLLENETVRHAMRKRAYLLGREMIWPKVAQRYIESFQRAKDEPLVKPISEKMTRMIQKGYDDNFIDLPILNLYHFTKMTDETGILQHAILSLPNYHEGYTTDDNARALLVSIQLESIGEMWFTGADELASRYLSFLWYAYNRETGRFRNFLGYNRTWKEEVGSQDSHGRALMGLGAVVRYTDNETLRTIAVTLFNWAVPVVQEFTSPRAWSYSLLGIRDYLHRFAGDRSTQLIGKQLLERLASLYHNNNQPDWNWFESKVTYGNFVLSQAMLSSFDWSGKREYVEIGIESLRWLTNIQCSPEGFFSPVGSNGFFQRDSEKANFDQQPIEANESVAACLEAYRISGDRFWHQEAHRSFQWFLGANVLGLSLYDSKTGGCRDGLHPDRANQNQGAESTLSFLQSLLLMRSTQSRFRERDGRLSSLTILPVQSTANNS